MAEVEGSATFLTRHPVQLAIEARNYAYTVPHYAVGAALCASTARYSLKKLTSENAHMPSSCAERTAFFRAGV